MASFEWPPQGSGGSGSGTVTSVSVVSANGLAGTVSNPTTTPAITLSTSITGLLQGNGTAISAYTGGNLTDVGTDGIVITGGTGAVIGAGTSIAQSAASASQNGYLKSTDWSTFNGKQAAGNYITALTGDITASGPGSVAATLATVNSNVGSFTYSSITVNAKGLVTAASNGTAPVTTLAGVGSSPNANAATISGNTLNLQPFSSSQPGVVLSSGGGTTNFLRADGTWAAPTGSSGITALTGDGTATGPGSVALTLATVNTNTGSFGSLSNIPSFTVNGKGLITAASNNAASSTPAASQFSAWDSNSNLSANNMISGYATTATAAGTTTLTVSSPQQQYFTGTTTQTVVMPAVSTLVLGQQYTITNNSTGVVTVESSGSNTIQAMGTGSTLILTCIATTGTTASSWNVFYQLPTGLVLTDWSSALTFTPTNFGTINTNNIFYKRVGDTMFVQGTFSQTTATSSTAYIAMPSGYTIDTNKMSSASAGSMVGNYISIVSSTSREIYSTPDAGILFFDGSTNNEIFFATNTGSNAIQKIAANAIASSGNFTLNFMVPITSWAST